MPKTITLRLEDEAYETLREHSEAEKRPLSNYIEMAALEYTKAQEFLKQAWKTATSIGDKEL